MKRFKRLSFFLLMGAIGALIAVYTLDVCGLCQIAGNSKVYNYLISGRSQEQAVNENLAPKRVENKSTQVVESEQNVHEEQNTQVEAQEVVVTIQEENVLTEETSIEEELVIENQLPQENENMQVVIGEDVSETEDEVAELISDEESSEEDTSELPERTFIYEEIF